MTATLTTPATNADSQTLSDQTPELATFPALAACALPYWPIWAAAQFASTEEHKQLLNFVHVFKDGDAYQIESTDGYRAFRYRFPAGGDNYRLNAWEFPDSGLLLHAAPLRKAVPLAKILTVSKDLRAYIHGGKKKAVIELASYNLSGFYGIHSTSDAASHTYPRINSKWPEQFTNNIGNPWSLNAKYLKEWFAVVEKLSPSGVTKMQGNSPVAPFVFSCNYREDLGGYPDALLQYLIMPVQIRE